MTECRCCGATSPARLGSMGMASSATTPWDWGLRIEEMEERRLARVESGVEGEGLSPVVE